MDVHAPIPPLAFTRRLAEALGLGDLPVRELVLRSPTDGRVEVDVKFLVRLKDGDAVADLVRTFYLVEHPAR